MIGTKWASKHCNGKRCEITEIDHTGETRAKCDCGETYVHRYGAYGTPEQAKKITENMFAFKRAGLEQLIGRTL